MWEAVLQLHAHRVTHRALTGDRIMLADDGDVVLLDPGSGGVAATDLQLRLDLAQLLAELALLVGPDQARLAVKAVGADELVAVVPLLQPMVSPTYHPGGRAPPQGCPARAAQAASRRRSR